MRKKIVAGNWKMNFNLEEALELTLGVNNAIAELKPNTEVVLFPSFPLLRPVQDVLKANISLGAQNLNQFNQGAYTGEVSAEMLDSLGVQYVLIGHSERRHYFFETDAIVAEKINRALEHNLKPVVCVGESLKIRENKQHIEFVSNQIINGIFHLTEQDFKQVIIAYEPVWAIGTGKTAQPEEAQEMHLAIRQLVSDKYGEQIAQETSLLYGGSCKPTNALELFSQADIDGGLIGGASLKADLFSGVYEAL